MKMGDLLGLISITMEENLNRRGNEESKGNI